MSRLHGATGDGKTDDTEAIQTPRPITALAAGVSDVRLRRVWVVNGLNNVIIER